MDQRYWKPTSVRVKINGVIPQIETDRAQREWFIEKANEGGLTRWMCLGGALLVARSIDQRGTVADKCRLANVLSMVAYDAAERGDHDRLDAYSGELLAVLAELADEGDEDLAIAINDVVPVLTERVQGFGKAWARLRRDRL